MPDRPTPPDWILEQSGLTAIALLSALLGLVVLLPYLQYVLFGVVLAYILFPVQRRLEQYVRPAVAAIALVVATLLVVLLPLIYVVTIAVRQALGIVPAIRQGQLDVETVEAILETNGYTVDVVAVYEANQGRIATALQQIATGAIDFAGSLPSLFIGLTITLFVLFALLRDGERLVDWFHWVLPVEDRILADLREGLDQLMWASVVGNVAVAAIQAVMLGVGLAIAGLPAVVFLTVATFVLTLLPLVGAFGVWIPAAGYLLAVGRPTAGAAMVVYGLLVTFSDSYLRPALIGQTSAFNSAIVVVGIFGGLVAFGAVGLFIGPVVLGGAKLTIDSFARGHTGEPAPGASPGSSGGDSASAETATEGETGSDGADEGGRDE
ncbi:AI-2E family transporter [Halosolutus amylolyticus]|uniref:AI-2E family transporter n=1 Tax=Halosolutus amylolyticus TaxID=2932267 RepID=A0ABD5PQS9_9EURY|nr:AI-2E family transporter [Halosolutus amylolyticus]